MELNWMLDEYDGIVYVIDLDTYKLMYMNACGCRVVGVEKDKVIGRECYKVIHGLDVPCTFCNDPDGKIEGFFQWEMQNERLGKSFLLKNRNFYWDNKRARIIFATDVSDYQRKIKNSENRRESVLKTLPGGIARIDARDGVTVLSYAARFLPLIGYTASQFETELKNRQDYIHPDDRDKVSKTLNLARETKEIVMAEVRIVRRDGAIRILNMTFNFEEGYRSEDGLPSFYSMCIDISEARAQEKLQQAALEDAVNAAKSANMAKARFLSSVSHDIRTPMNAILGLTNIASRHVNEPEKVQDCLDKIGVSSNHLLRLINNVLDMSRIDSGKMQLQENSFELPELVRNVLDICRPLLAAKDQTIEVDAGRVKHEKLIGDMNRLQQIFMNFLSNAIKYTPNGGKIVFTINEKPYDESSSIFEFVFTDNGIGMTPEFVKQVFEPFARADDPTIARIQGTGLGMAITANLVHLMNGTIEVESEVGKGSRFSVTVPLGMQEERERVLSELAGMPVLVVDRNQAVCQSTCLILHEMGMTGDWVTSGRDAVERVVRARESGKDYFAVILECNMPDMDGFETSRAICDRLRPNIPILILSASDCSEMEQKCHLARANTCIVKPFFKSGMLDVFSRFTSEPTQKNMSKKMVAEPLFDLNGIHILLVEDNLLNMEIVKELLELEGVIVDTAENGRDAVDLFSRSPPGFYDVILMDVQMPVMDGYEASARIRKLERNDAESIVIIALTANAFANDVNMASRAGMNDHVSKPVDIHKLYRVIGKLLLKNRTPVV